LLLLNKTDLPSAATARERLQAYRQMGLPVLEAALKTAPEAAIALLRPMLAGKTTLILGASGMGKSTLINLILPEAQAQVGEISQALHAGRHTTTTTTWYWLDEAKGEAADGGAAVSGSAQLRGALLDSPGFQEFGLMHIAPERLADLMPDLKAHLGHCRFYNCTHQHEPGCGVRDAVQSGDITSHRYALYLMLREELTSAQRRSLERG
jgi:ribosome biogenesis GTPase